MDKRRAAFWTIFLGVAGVLASIPEYFFPPEEEALLVPPVTRDGQVPVPLVELPEQRPPPRAAAPPATGGSGLFGAHSWRVAAVPAPARAWTPAPAVTVPPVAVAPAVPFAFIGKLDDARRMRVFLTRGEKIYTVSVGDVIDGAYRVERIADSEMILTYLPLNVRQTLAVGSKL